MGFALVRLPAYNVNIIVVRGRVSSDEISQFYGNLDSDDPGSAGNLITYIDMDADYSDVPVTAFPQFRKIVIPKLKQLLSWPRYRDTIVCNSEQSEMVADFWRHYVEMDPEYSSPPVIFTELKDACDWLELPDLGCDAVANAIRAQLLKPPPRAGLGHVKPKPDAKGP